jgi:hypothetical protein
MWTGLRRVTAHHPHLIKGEILMKVVYTQAKEWRRQLDQRTWVDENFCLDRSDSNYWIKLDQIEECLQLILDDDQPSQDHDGS